MLRVLIVDDDKRIRNLIATIVAELSSEILQCENGRLAQINYAAFHPDWVLMDLRMPGVDGIAATRRIRSVYPDAKIIILTSYESQAMREIARLAGAHAYLLKENIADLPDILLCRSV